MKTCVLGFPRIGKKRELKKEIEKYWKGNSNETELLTIAKNIKIENWQAQKDTDIDFISSNDFSFYDQVLDTCLLLGCIPERFKEIQKNESELDLYFAMARGLQNDKHDAIAMEMTKWFDTNYHYIVPEFTENQSFKLFSTKVIEEFKEAKALSIQTKPVFIGPITFLNLGKNKEDHSFNKLSLLKNILPVYLEAIDKLVAEGVTHIQFDEPCLALHISDKEKEALNYVYSEIRNKFPNLTTILASYFDDFGDNLKTALNLPVTVLHLDLVKAPQLLQQVVTHKEFCKHQTLSLGVIDGRNIWKNDFETSLAFINEAKKHRNEEQIWISTSCSLLHSPYDLELENDNHQIPSDIKNWLAFATQKVTEVATLSKLINQQELHILEDNKKAIASKKTSSKIHHKNVGERLQESLNIERNSTFTTRQQLQKEALQLPLFPTTTIGSFPQTKEVRKWRADYKKDLISDETYTYLLEKETEETIRFQETIDIDVLVHGEFERNDMVEYFGERLEGFIFTNFGWVQSYGTRCVKPPIIFGDVYRPKPMTIKWATFAQSLTSKYVKGMLTGPITILQWSFVRNDQPRKTTCEQIALAIRDEVIDLEQAGIKIIQIDEPAIREGLPLRKEQWQYYLNWAIDCFKISASGVKDTTQIHTHMCYSEFNDIISNIADMDADVITIETSRSHMELLDAFVDFKYPNEIGPGVYDIHSPRVPTQNEITNLVKKAIYVLPIENIWINPDCGLKTRNWPETKSALENLVSVAKGLRKEIGIIA